jgi:methyl-accepting chemotaxis protein
MEDAGKMAAIARSQAVIDLNLDGTIIGANEVLLEGMGYSLPEIVGVTNDMSTSMRRAAAEAASIGRAG